MLQTASCSKCHHSFIQTDKIIFLDGHGQAYDDYEGIEDALDYGFYEMICEKCYKDQESEVIEEFTIQSNFSKLYPICKNYVVFFYKLLVFDCDTKEEAIAWCKQHSIEDIPWIEEL